jgi:2-phosphoglycerate kinase
MIFLIGGNPRGGKSTLAKMLSQKKSIPYISIDDITSIIKSYIPENDHHEKFPQSMHRIEVNHDNDAYFTKYTAEEIINFYYKQAETIWAGVQKFIEYALARNLDYILEGWEIFPEFLQTVINNSNKNHIKVVFLVKEEHNEIVRGIKIGKSQNDWILKDTHKEETYLKIAEMISAMGKKITTEAQKGNFLIINMDNNFEDKLNSLLETI